MGPSDGACWCLWPSSGQSRPCSCPNSNKPSDSEKNRRNIFLFEQFGDDGTIIAVLTSLKLRAMNAYFFKFLFPCQDVLGSKILKSARWSENLDRILCRNGFVNVPDRWRPMGTTWTLLICSCLPVISRRRFLDTKGYNVSIVFGFLGDNHFMGHMMM